MCQFMWLMVCVLASLSTMGTGGDATMNWSELKDATSVRWAHAVNSRVALLEALAGVAQFLEADVSSGKLFGDGEDPAETYPVMAHSSTDGADIKLSDWLQQAVVNNPQNKGIKLDFKDATAVEQSVAILSPQLEKIGSRFPVWVNADILPGVGPPKDTPVDPNVFIGSWKNVTSNLTFSLGWTTHLDRSMDFVNFGYTWRIVYDMYNTLVKFDILSRPLTFPVRAVYCRSQSMAPLRWLMSVAPNSTLTVWGHAAEGELIEPGLQTLLTNIPKNRLYVDLPQFSIDAVESFANSSNSSTDPTKDFYTVNVSDFDVEIVNGSTTIRPIFLLNAMDRINVHLGCDHPSFHLSRVSGVINPTGDQPSSYDLIIFIDHSSSHLFRIKFDVAKISLTGTTTDSVDTKNCPNILYKFSVEIDWADSVARAEVQLQSDRGQNGKFGNIENCSPMLKLSTTISDAVGASCNRMAISGAPAVYEDLTMTYDPIPVVGKSSNGAQAVLRMHVFIALCCFFHIFR